MATTKPSFARSIDTTTILEMIRELEVGQVLTHARMTAEIGRDVQQRGRGALDAARRIALKEHGIATGAVTGIGIKRLDDTEIVDSGAQDLSMIRRRASRAALRTSKVADFAAMPREVQTRHNLHMTLFAMIKHETSAPQIRRHGKHVDDESKPLAIGSALELCK